MPRGKAEGPLRHRGEDPGPRRRLFLPRLRDSAYFGEGEEEEEEGGGGGLARLLDSTFGGLSRSSLCVRENPFTGMGQGYLRPLTPSGAFCYHAAWKSVTRHGAKLHGLLQRRHRLLLACHYSRRLKAASDFVRRLVAAQRQEASWGHLLRGLCEELRTHTSHWEKLRRRIHGNPWLRPLLWQRPGVVLQMRQRLSRLALQAIHLVEHSVEAMLQSLAQATPLSPALLADFFQGLDVYTQVVNDQELQWPLIELRAETEARFPAFPVERVVDILATERGRLLAQRVYPLLSGQPAETAVGNLVPLEERAKPLHLGVTSQVFWAGEGPSSLSIELQVMCREEEALLLLVLGELVASTDSLWHHLLKARLKQEKPLECLEAACPLEGSEFTSPPSCKARHWLDTSYKEAAALLVAQYRSLVWRAMTSALAHQLELSSPLAQYRKGKAAALGQQLSHAVAQACIPHESGEELRALSLRLFVRDILQSWDQNFCRALGSSLTDKCQAGKAACSQSAELLRGLYQPLASPLEYLDAEPPGSADVCLELLSLLVATSQASCYWVMSRAYRYLASWSLSPFLLVTQGDLQVLQVATKKTSALTHAVFSDGRRKQHRLASHQEQELRLQIHSLANSIELFAQEVMRLFFLYCKRMSTGIFCQTMPLGKNWRPTLQSAELPLPPSEYAAAATQTVLGQVLQGIQSLSQGAQGLVLCQATTAFLEAWLEHILAQQIKFSLQGALQLKQDFDLVRDLLQSLPYGLSPETKRLVLALHIFQQMDNAVACLLQQPSKASLPLPNWLFCHKCCTCNGIRTEGDGPGSLNSLESLEGLPAQAGAALGSQVGDRSRVQGASSSPETYLSPTQQEWLALRLHGGRRWRGPSLSCVSRVSES